MVYQEFINSLIYYITNITLTGATQPYVQYCEYCNLSDIELSVSIPEYPRAYIIRQPYSIEYNNSMYDRASVRIYILDHLSNGRKTQLKTDDDTNQFLTNLLFALGNYSRRCR